MITLRKFTPYDTDIFFQLSRSNQDIATFIPGLIPSNPAEASDYVSEFATVDFVREFDFLIINELNIPVGMIEASQSFESFQTINSLNVVYFIANDYRRKGYMKEALQEFISYIQANTNYASLLFDVNTKNTPSLNLVTGIGGKFIPAVNRYDSKHQYYRLRIDF